MRGDRRKILLFAGTTEGRLLWEYLLEKRWPAVACVATGYGKDVLGGSYVDAPGAVPGPAGMDIRQGRLEPADMEALLDEIRPGLVIDATHPYAVKVTEQIRKACRGREGLRLIRCLREESRMETDPEIIHVPDVKAAAEWLSSGEGSILVTTGSKELEAYCRVTDYRERIYARVLPSLESIKLCRSLGYDGRHIIAMQGPFSEDMNLALLREYDCRYLVTKDGGLAGGFEAKIKAAKRAKAVAVVIDRPGHGGGLSLEEVKRQIKEWMDYEKGRTIYG